MSTVDLPYDYNNIPNAESITPEDIKTFEKVLKYCANAKGTTFSHNDAIDILKRTSNNLRYFLKGLSILHLNVYSNQHKRFVAVDELKKRIVTVQCYGEPQNHFLKYFRDCQPSDTFPVVDGWGYTEEENKTKNF